MTVKKVNKGGRPRKYNDVDKMQQKIDEYFDIGVDYVTITAFDKQTGEFVEYKKTTPTITGLALYLGFVSRQSMFDYEAKPEFSDIIKRLVLELNLNTRKCSILINVQVRFLLLKILAGKISKKQRLL